MTLSEAIQTLRKHNEWRRDNTGEILMLDPAKIGEAIDIACDVLEADEEL